MDSKHPLMPFAIGEPVYMFLPYYSLVVQYRVVDVAVTVADGEMFYNYDLIRTGYFSRWTGRFNTIRNGPSTTMNGYFLHSTPEAALEEARQAYIRWRRDWCRKACNIINDFVDFISYIS